MTRFQHPGIKEDLDAQLAADARWFIDHPFAKSRQRKPYFNEIVAVYNLTGNRVKKVIIFQIKPGVRVKKFLFA